MNDYSLMPRPTILFTTPVLHHPPIGGPTLRIENSIKSLSQIVNLYIYSRVSPGEMGGSSAIKFYQTYCQEFYLSPFYLQKNSWLKKIKSLPYRVINKPRLCLSRAARSPFDFSSASTALAASAARRSSAPHISRNSPVAKFCSRASLPDASSNERAIRSPKPR